MRSRFVSLLILASLFANQAWAFGRSSSSDTPAPGPSAVPPIARFEVTPASLREKILIDNLSILDTLNQLHQAKETVNRDRGSLLPSLNLGTTVSGGNFILSAMSVLLPFLMPSRWFQYDQDQKLLEAQKQAYYITELNTYAQAYALYVTVAGYQQIRDLYEAEYKDYAQIDGIQSDSYRLHVASARDAQQAHAAAAKAQYQLAVWNEKILASKAALRSVLNLPLATEIIVTPTVVPALPYEQQSVESVAQQAIARAPEIAQLILLAQAADEGKWNVAFGLIGNVAVNATSGGSSNDNSRNVSFGNSTLGISTGTGGGIGFATYPAIRLSNESRDRVLIQKDQMELTQRQTIEVALGSIQAAAEQAAHAADSEASQQRVYDIEKDSWRLGVEPLYQLLLTHALLTDAGVNRAAAMIELNSQRITLHRAMLEGEFARIAGCAPNIKNQSGLTGWVHSLFGDGGIESIDQACHPAGPALPAN